MANKSNLNITALDFDTIKSSLKEYLKGQEQFRDYDFEGSALSTLLDVLAYNTHYQAFYANMVANETFIDSANKRESVVSIAKHLGYTPKSYKSAVAYVNVEITNPTTDILTAINNGIYYVEKNDQFLTSVDNKRFSFLANDNYQVKNISGSYVAQNVELKEGVSKTISFVYDPNSSTEQKFEIPEFFVDTDSIEVRISESADNITGIEDLWSKVEDINLLNSESKVFFIQQNYNLKYEIYFGDGILGRKPDPGNFIVIQYRITNGSIGNNLGKNETSNNLTFSYSANSSSKVTLVTDTNGDPTPTFGGSDFEDISSVKYYAPRNYQAQNRAVTAEDYRTILANQYGEQAESVYVWGGEDNDPPIYGKVFISIKPVNAKKITQLEKLAIAQNILKSKNIVSIIPEVIDPDYIYLKLNLGVKYDSSKITQTSSSFASAVKNSLFSYLTSNIGKFDQNFYYSNLLAYIDQIYSPPLISNTLTIKLQKRIELSLGTIASYTINFDNELYHPIAGYTSILSTNGFMYQDSTSEEEIKPEVEAYLDDDGNGNVRIYKLTNSAKVILNESIGSIDYTTGKINLVNFNPQSFIDSGETELKLTLIPSQTDVLCRRNQILLIENSDLTVTATPVTLRYDPYSASGSSFRNTNNG